MLNQNYYDSDDSDDEGASRSPLISSPDLDERPLQPITPPSVVHATVGLIGRKVNGKMKVFDESTGEEVTDITEHQMQRGLITRALQAQQEMMVKEKAFASISLSRTEEDLRPSVVCKRDGTVCDTPSPTNKENASPMSPRTPPPPQPAGWLSNLFSWS
eukprot:m.28155 g.28155  ORF g.28155 m.28155 type:complete len:159 (+) comp15875_c0_seq1:218-694(+)